MEVTLQPDENGLEFREITILLSDNPGIADNVGNLAFFISRDLRPHDLVDVLSSVLPMFSRLVSLCQPPIPLMISRSMKRQMIRGKRLFSVLVAVIRHKWICEP